MRNIFKSIVGALTIASALATAVPAQARPDGWRDRGEYRGDHRRYRHGDRDWDRDRPRYRQHYRHHGYRDYGRNYYPRGGYYAYRDYPRGYYRYRDRDDDTGAILAAGIIGLAVGAVIASDRDGDGYRHRDYYDD